MLHLKVQAYIRQCDLIQPGDEVVVGVSGGADSIALSHILSRLSKRMKFGIVIAHLNHQIRGKAADEDEAFVKAWAETLGVEFLCERRDVPKWANEQSISTEMAARAARHEFFRTCGGEAVAVAHTADDQAETVLMRFLRGSGARGLGGMLPVATLRGLKIIRPLLGSSRAGVEEYLRRENIPWREDASNRDPKHVRNRVRHTLLPLLEKEFNPAIRETLRRTAAVLGDEDRILAEWAVQSADIDKSYQLRLNHWRAVPMALQRRILMGWLEGRGYPPEHIDFDLVQRALRLMDDLCGTERLTLENGWVLVRRYRHLQLIRETEDAASFAQILLVPGTTEMPREGWRISTKWSKGILKTRPTTPGRIPATASISAAKVGRAAIVVRSWRDGDRMKPYGLRGSKKLQDIFVDAKIPRDTRHTIPVFECRKEIIWIPGYRIARDWALKSESEPALHLRIRRA